MQITALPLNGGSAIYCDAPGRAGDLLVDCGNSNSVNRVTEPFLRAQGVNRLPQLLLTHGDVRNVGGATLLQTHVPVLEVITSALPFRSRVYSQITNELQMRPGLWRKAVQGDSVAGWQVLYPGADDLFPKADDKAIVLRRDCHGTRVLLLSELGWEGQRALLNQQTNLQADIVIAGLPQDSQPLNEALLEAIQPRLIVITDSEYPATRRADAALHNRLEAKGIHVLYTRSTGAVTITIKKGGWSVSGASGVILTMALIDK